MVFDFTMDPEEMFRDMAYEVNDGNLLEGNLLEVLEIDNREEVLKNIGGFIQNAVRYGWYRHILSMHGCDKVNEVFFIFSKIKWRERGECFYVYLGLTGGAYVSINSNHPLDGEHGFPSRHAIVCTGRDAGFLSEGVLSEMPGVVRLGSMPSVLDDFIGKLRPLMPAIIPKGNHFYNDFIVCYDLKRFKVPVVPVEEYPLYVSANQIVRVSLRLGEVLRGVS